MAACDRSLEGLEGRAGAGVDKPLSEIEAEQAQPQVELGQLFNKRFVKALKGELQVVDNG